MRTMTTKDYDGEGTVLRRNLDASSTMSPSLLHCRLLSSPRPESNPIHTSLIVGFAAGALSAALAYLLCLFVHQCVLRMLCCQQPPPQEPRAAAGLIGGLPMTVYDSASGAVLKGETGCAVCLTDYADGEEVRVLPRCGHAFHRECIDRWLVKGSRACPVCCGLVFEEERPVGPAETGAVAEMGNLGLAWQQLL